MSNELILAKHSGILSLTLIIYIWIALLLIRYNDNRNQKKMPIQHLYIIPTQLTNVDLSFLFFTIFTYYRYHHENYFNQSNFITLLLICIVRTMIELSSTFNIFGMFITTTTAANNDRNWWMNNTKWWCHSRMFIIIYQLQIICSLFTVFLFQNVIILLLANKIYLTKNYYNILQSLKQSKQLQLLITILFPLIHQFIIFIFVKNFHTNCWPIFNSIVTAFFVTSSILQITLVRCFHNIPLHSNPNPKENSN